jgi:aspartate 1-decarboxylase
MDAADLLEFEQVAVVDVDNGARLETYVIEGERGSGAICLNGAAAHLIHPGDRVIIISYCEVDDAELKDGWQPTVVHVDTANRQISEELAKQVAGERRYVEIDAAANERLS